MGIVSVSIVLFALCAFGCHTPLAVKQIQAKNPLAKNAAKTPTTIVDVWSCCAQKTPEGKMVRGMAGQIHFYDDQKDNRAVKVDGDLTVFMFDGNETDPAHTKPLKVYQFNADTLNQHYVYKKPLGHGYDFFLPIDEIGGEEKSISIIVRFDNKLEENDYVITKPVNTLLAGRRPASPADPSIREFLESRSLLAEAHQNMTAAYDSSVIQQVVYISEKEGESEKSKVLTIPLNSGMTRRLLEAKDTVPVDNTTPIKHRVLQEAASTLIN